MQLAHIFLLVISPKGYGIEGKHQTEMLYQFFISVTNKYKNLL